MDRRSHESPMDFEWQSEAPADVTSPFYKLTQAQGQRRGFDSPAKPMLPRPDTASLFTSTANTAAPFRNPSFITPRKSFDPDLFSETSGAESSPAENADAEDTPETIKTQTTMTTFPSSSTHKRPLFGRYGVNFTASSPGRGEIRRGKYTDAVIRKVRKRRRTDRDYALAVGRRGSSDLESDDEHSKSRGGEDQPYSSPPQGWLAATLSFIESRPALPYILSYYAQLLLNYFLVGFVIYLVWCFFLTIRADVDKASEAAAGAVLAEMAECAAQYAQNRCSKDQRVPAMQAVCENWEKCMNRDPSHVGRARVSAHTFAEIFNSLVEPISWKAMAFVLLIIVVVFGAPNVAFGVFRKSSNPSPVPQYYNPQPPATPSHSQDYRMLFQQTPRHPSQPLEHDIYRSRMGLYPSIMPSQTPGRGSPRKGSRY